MTVRDKEKTVISMDALTQKSNVLYTVLNPTSTYLANF